MPRRDSGIVSDSSRESSNRWRTGRLLENKERFSWLEDDDLGSNSLERLGETVTRIAHYALVTANVRLVYRFYLTADGKVADFGSERR
jgi:hypothetical protein